MGKLLIWLLAAGKMGKLLTTGGTMLLTLLVYGLALRRRFPAAAVRA
jgi:hypothetical protein